MQNDNYTRFVASTIKGVDYDTTVKQWRLIIYMNDNELSLNIGYFKTFIKAVLEKRRIYKALTSGKITRIRKTRETKRQFNWFN